MKFDYSTAFSRNIGWVNKDEQNILRSKRVAIAGMGGVGGSHILTLTRLGIGAFHIADFDTFELANFNRQTGASMSSIGQPKVDVLAEMALGINPSLDIKKFSEGINGQNLSEFFTNVDLFVDGLDFFAFDARQYVFESCAELEIPAVTAAPLGMGAAMLNFMPGKMTFEEYFRLDGQPEEQQILRFLLGLSPAMLQRGYLVDPSAVDLANHKGPSTPMACELCAGLAASQALKILLNRGKVLAAPWGLHLDAYSNKMVRTWRPRGNRNPVQRLGLTIARRQFMAEVKQDDLKLKTKEPTTVLEKILDTARWAPSGDNTQPWRFEIIDDQHIVVHGFDTRDHCVYDLQGHASQMAIGALLESISIAASVYGLKVETKFRRECPETEPTIDVFFEQDQTIKHHPLEPYIKVRTVQRRAMKTRDLIVSEKSALDKAVGDAYRIVWIEGWKGRWKAALLMFKNAKLRLMMPEAYAVHKSVIEWNARFSDDKIPDEAIGLDPITTKLMKWVMVSWTRVRFFNTYFAGTWLPRIEMDLVPSIWCSAHFAIMAEKEPGTVEDYIAAGQTMQRFWLTATKLGLQLQPEMTPLIFSGYVSKGVKFTRSEKLCYFAEKLSLLYADLFQNSNEDCHAVFFGRVGVGEFAKARSVRKSLEHLIATPSRLKHQETK